MGTGDNLKVYYLKDANIQLTFCFLPAKFLTFSHISSRKRFSCSKRRKSPLTSPNPRATSILVIVKRICVRVVWSVVGIVRSVVWIIVWVIRIITRATISAKQWPKVSKIIYCCGEFKTQRNVKYL